MNKFSGVVWLGAFVQPDGSEPSPWPNEQSGDTHDSLVVAFHK